MNDQTQLSAFDPEEYEEISSDEVDRVVAALEKLVASTESENVRAILEAASNDIYYLVYEDEAEETEGGEESIRQAA